MPPDEAEYQSTVSPASTVAVSVGIELPAQYDLLPPPTGAVTTGHVHPGAFTVRLFTQPLPSVKVRIRFELAITPVMFQTLPPAGVTVPKLPVRIPLLTVTPTEYVSRSGEQVAGVVTVIVGNAFIVSVIPVRTLLLQFVVVFLASA